MFSLIGFLVFVYLLVCLGVKLGLVDPFEFTKDFAGYSLVVASSKDEPLYVHLDKE